ncbi:tryptophan-rich sensory protein [Fodinibius sp. AD559]|uniref:tryptophan-rich sensory protein n=1 Tax=Fodinibius sp. AD559 TaxID=3424179 RepID=UPI004046A5D9
MKKTLQIANIVALIVTIILNYVAGAGLINGQTIGDISARYDNLFTPAGYAFSIWGFIYLMLIGFVIYQARGLFKKVDNDSFILQIGWWFVISCIANSFWLIAWVHDYIGLSVILIAVLLISLMKIIVNTNMERWDAPFPKIVLLWWPFCFYSGWITVAVIANISAYLTKIGWEGLGISDVTWAIIMIVAAGLINLFMIITRNMREFALVGIWALIAVAVTNWGTYQPIVITAFTVSVILFVAISIHGYQNRHTAPHIKFKQMRES